MSFGNWIEERQFDHPADLVFETLLGLVHRSGFTIRSYDAELRGVVAEQPPTYWEWQSRLAASVQSIGDSKASLTLEIGPAYDARMSESRYKKRVSQMLTELTRALEE